MKNLQYTLQFYLKERYCMTLFHVFLLICNDITMKYHLLVTKGLKLIGICIGMTCMYYVTGILPLSAGIFCLKDFPFLKSLFYAQNAQYCPCYAIYKTLLFSRTDPEAHEQSPAVRRLYQVCLIFFHSLALML